MKLILALLLLPLTFSGFAQSTIGIQAGVGATTSYLKPMTPTLNIGGYFLEKQSTRVAFGGVLSIQKYSFTKNVGTTYNTAYGDILSISQKTSYLFLCPKIEFSIGKRQHLHAGFSVGPGVFVGGRQQDDINYSSLHSSYPPSYPPAFIRDSMQITANNNINKMILRAQLSFTEHIATNSSFGIFIFQDFSFISSYVSKNALLSTVGNSNSLLIRTNYVSCGIGFTNCYSRKSLRDKRKSGKKYAHGFDYE